MRAEFSKDWRDTFAMISQRITNANVVTPFRTRPEIISRWRRENPEFDKLFDTVPHLQKMTHSSPIMDRVDDVIASHTGAKSLSIICRDLVIVLKETRDEINKPTC